MILRSPLGLTLENTRSTLCIDAAKAVRINTEGIKRREKLREDDETHAMSRKWTGNYASSV